MKKNVLQLLLLCGVGLYAQDNTYIGASYDYNLLQYTDDYTGQHANQSSISTSFSIGKYFGDYRLHIGLGTSNAIGIGGDYMFHLKESKFTPFIGTSVYYYYNSEKYSGTSKVTYSLTNNTIKGIILGACLGFTYPINEHFEFETSLIVGKFIVSQRNNLSYQSFSTGINYLF